MEVVFVFVSLFIVVFGIVYLYYSTRHKERLALIEKGVDASIFFSPKLPRTTSVWRILNLNLALICIGIGLGIIIGSILESYTNLGEASYPAAIFLTGGLGLLIGFFQIKKMD
jgi:hypothetical protein